MKQNSSLRFVQSDFVRYFIVISDQPSDALDEQFTKLCQAVKSDFPNSFLLYIDPKLCVKSDDANTSLNDVENDTSVDTSLTNSVASLNIDPLNAAINDEQQSNTNSSFYNELVSQRQQNLNSNFGNNQSVGHLKNQSSMHSRDIISDWLSNLDNLDYLKSVTEAMSSAINVMIK